MKLIVATPTSVAVDADVVSVRAEDETGGFGILDGHADFLTVLPISILRWRASDGAENYCALRRGVLTVSGGTTVHVAAREAIVSDDFEHLETVVLARFREAAEEEHEARARKRQRFTWPRSGHCSLFASRARAGAAPRHESIRRPQTVSSMPCGAGSHACAVRVRRANRRWRASSVRSACWDGSW